MNDTQAKKDRELLEVLEKGNVHEHIIVEFKGEWHYIYPDEIIAAAKHEAVRDIVELIELCRDDDEQVDTVLTWNNAIDYLLEKISSIQE